MSMYEPPYHDYLGNGVYVHTEEPGVYIIRAGDHDSHHSVIWIWPETLAAFDEYRKRIEGMEKARFPR